MTPNIQKLIDDYDSKYQSIIDDLNALTATDALNVAVTKAHGTGNEALITDLSVLITQMKLLSIVFSIRHRNSASTAMTDCNNGITIQKFAQTLDDMRKYYQE